jgi:hypothetical protein
MMKERSMRNVFNAAQFREIGTYRNLVEKPKGKRLLGRHRSRWEDDIKINNRLLFVRYILSI